jgi:translation initiation factor eIF-2B subunit epsilon
VHEEAQVITSTIGASCTIGTGTVLRNAYLFDNVTIGPKCVLESCIVGAGVQVGEGSSIARGSLVADGVKLGPGTVLRPFDRVSKQRQKSDSSTTEDGSDDGDDDSELEEAEQSTHSESFARDPLLNAYPLIRSRLIRRPTFSFAESGCWLRSLRVAPENCRES